MTSDNVRNIVTLAAVLLAFFLGRAALIRERRLRRHAHKRALRAELDLCEEDAKTYISDPVAAPLYRLPTWAFESAFPSLLQDGVLSEEQVRVLERYFGLVQQINRGLDQIHSATERDDQKAIGREMNRLTAKCRKFLGLSQGESYLSRARWAVFQIK
jgi:hypothetical protein